MSCDVTTLTPQSRVTSSVTSPIECPRLPIGKNPLSPTVSEIFCLKCYEFRTILLTSRLGLCGYTRTRGLPVPVPVPVRVRVAISRVRVGYGYSSTGTGKYGYTRKFIIGLYNDKPHLDKSVIIYHVIIVI